MKRLVDLLLSSIGIVLLLPIFVIVSGIIGLSEGRPIFFRQKRIGLGGKPFAIWKFRTMIRDAEKQGASLTVGHDARITPIGHWLRKTKLDELPQLLNVLLGEMSFVGPRPEVPHYVDQYNDVQKTVLQLKPGITDPASIHFFAESQLLSEAESVEELYVNEIMPEKIRLNLKYAQQAHFGSDLGVILKTLKRLAA